MRKDFIITLLAISCFAAYGQNYDPYAVFGHKSDVIYETQKDFFKIFNSDTNSVTKALIFDIEKGIVLILGTHDTILQKEQINPELLLRWLSTDPLSQKYPQQSPYNFVVNNPINAIDPDGKDVVFLIDNQGAGGSGHMGMLFQNKAGAWFYFSQGAMENGSTSGFVSGSNYAGGVGIMPMQTVTKSGEVINMTKEQALEFVKSGSADGTQYDKSLTLKTTKKQDALITNNAYALQQDYQTKKEEYNLYTNNCVDAVQDVVEGTKGVKTGITLPNDSDPRPNEYFKQLQISIPWMNGDMQLLTIPSKMDNIPTKQIVVPFIQQTIVE